MLTFLMKFYIFKFADVVVSTRIFLKICVNFYEVRYKATPYKNLTVVLIELINILIK